MWKTSWLTAKLLVNSWGSDWLHDGCSELVHRTPGVWCSGMSTGLSAGSLTSASPAMDHPCALKLTVPLCMVFKFKSSQFHELKSSDQFSSIATLATFQELSGHTWLMAAVLGNLAIKHFIVTGGTIGWGCSSRQVNRVAHSLPFGGLVK